jgi:AraC-like DNA-binding protein
MIGFAESKGYESAPLLRHLQLPTAELLLARSRLSPEEHSRLLEMHAIPAIHRRIHMEVIERGLDFLFDSFGTYVSLCLSSPTLHDAICNFIRYRPIVGSCDAVRAKRLDRRVIVEYRGECHRRPEADQAFIYFSMLQDLIRRYDPQGEVSSVMRLVSAATLPRGEYPEQAGSLLRFEQANNLLIIDAPILDEVVRDSNLFLYRMLAQQADREFTPLSRPTPFTDSVEGLIRQYLFCDSDMEPGRWRLVDYLSEQLCISRATLHRRLAAENMSCTGLLARVRAREATRLLMDGRKSVLEVSEVLGFANVSSFNRFFRERFNQTPLKYRRSFSD